MRRIMMRVLLYLLLVGIGLYIAIPFVWTFLSSVRYARELYAYIPTWIPRPLTFHRYIAIFTGREALQASPGQIVGTETLRAFRTGLWNSMLVSTGVTLICLIAGSLAAYAFARLNFKGRDKIFAVFVMLRFLPVLVLVIPLYIMMQQLGLLDTKVSLLLAYCSFTLPLVIWIMKAFFQTIPREIEDAAKVDGCSWIMIIFRIMLPLSTPGLITAGLLAFINAWQEFLFALVLTSSAQSKTLPVAMAEFFGRHGMDYGMTSTGAILAVIPVAVIAFVAQKYIVEGLLAGATVG